MKRFIFLLILILSLITPPVSADAKTLNVVTTLATFADLVKTIGGDHVSVSSVASPKFNAHFIEPRPSDVLKTKRADLFIHGGLDLEAWRPALLDAAGKAEFKPGGLRELDLSQGIELLQIPTRVQTRAEGDIHLFGNPHYWLSPVNIRRMAAAIAEKLSWADPDNSAVYDQNLKIFSDRLDAKISEWKAACEPHKGKILIGYHNEWIYLTDFLGLVMEEYLEPKPGVPPSPQHLQHLEQYIKSNNVKAIVTSAFYPDEGPKSLADRTGIAAVTLLQNVSEIPEAKDILSWLEYNISQTIQTLQ